MHPGKKMVSFAMSPHRIYTLCTFIADLEPKIKKQKNINTAHSALDAAVLSPCECLDDLEEAGAKRTSQPVGFFRALSREQGFNDSLAADKVAGRWLTLGQRAGEG